MFFLWIFLKYYWKEYWKKELDLVYLGWEKKKKIFDLVCKYVIFL